MDGDLRRIVDAIVANDEALFAWLIDAFPALATVSFAGDTALHFVAASYCCAMADRLLRAGAEVRAKNRRGGEPLHAAVFGGPGCERWDRAAQAATIVS